MESEPHPHANPSRNRLPRSLSPSKGPAPEAGPHPHANPSRGRRSRSLSPSKGPQLERVASRSRSSLRREGANCRRMCALQGPFAPWGRNLSLGPCLLEPVDGPRGSGTAGSGSADVPARSISRAGHDTLRERTLRQAQGARTSLRPRHRGRVTTRSGWGPFDGLRERERPCPVSTADGSRHALVGDPSTGSGNANVPATSGSRAGHHTLSLRTLRQAQGTRSSLRSRPGWRVTTSAGNGPFDGLRERERPCPVSTAGGSRHALVGDPSTGSGSANVPATSGSRAGHHTLSLRTLRRAQGARESGCGS